jgi:hypothetical protein
VVNRPTIDSDACQNDLLGIFFAVISPDESFGRTSAGFVEGFVLLGRSKHWRLILFCGKQRTDAHDSNMGDFSSDNFRMTRR